MTWLAFELVALAAMVGLMGTVAAVAIGTWRDGTD